MALLVAVTMALVVLPPAPDYSSAWRNGAAQMRGERSQLGTYEVTNVANLVMRPGAAGGFARPQVRVWMGRKGGNLVPAEGVRLRQGTTGAIRVSLPITEEMGAGTHTVVVLLGKDLSWADPSLPAWWWSRVDTELVVVEDP
jgi:hypothetical protein